MTPLSALTEALNRLDACNPVRRLASSVVIQHHRGAGFHVYWSDAQDSPDAYPSVAAVLLALHRRTLSQPHALCRCGEAPAAPLIAILGECPSADGDAVLDKGTTRGRVVGAATPILLDVAGAR